MPEFVERDCVIAGAGPAGMVLGYLLARNGLRVIVLEKHADFFRDFRGDTIHPATVRLLGELGLREKFLKLPLTRLETMDACIDGQRATMVDFRTLPEPNNFLVLAPQWDFLNFLAREAAAFDGFELRLATEASELLVGEDGRVKGVRATGSDGELLEIRATLTVAADGRSSVLRRAAGLVPVETGVPIDVLWFHLPKPSVTPPPTLAYFSPSGMVLTLDRGDYYQAGMVIRKGGLDALRSEGLGRFRERIASTAPFLAPVVDSLQSWRQVKLLSVQINHLPDWSRPGFIAIGDAAHAMSPMFGVGVNYAICDAVALADAVTGELSHGRVTMNTLRRVQKRREHPVKLMQRVQRLGHRGVSRMATRRRALPRPVVSALRVLSPATRPLAARFIGIGFRPEHFRGPSPPGRVDAAISQAVPGDATSHP